jgi:hypothetical protein
MCGECCRYIPLAVKGMPKDSLDYLRVRGLKEEQGFFLIPQTCDKLNMRVTEEGKTQWYCKIHATKPAVCKRFVGQSRIRDRRYYVPPGCGYRPDRD